MLVTPPERRKEIAYRAEPLSGYIAGVLETQEREESLSGLVRDLIAKHGEPDETEAKWAKLAL